MVKKISYHQSSTSTKQVNLNFFNHATISSGLLQSSGVRKQHESIMEAAENQLIIFYIQRANQMTFQHTNTPDQKQSAIKLFANIDRMHSCCCNL